jgi:CP family cyanate transporter-like MFS transporter
VIFGMPPVLPEIRADLHLTYLATGALPSLVTVVFGLAAIPGAILVNRFGAYLVLGGGTIFLGLAGLLRLLPPGTFWLFAGTGLLSLSVALAQPGLAVIARTWFPGRAQSISTVYSLGLTVGGLAASAGTAFLLGLGGWRGTFVIWSGLALAAGLLWLWSAPGREQIHEPAPHSFGALLRDGEVWRAAGLFGCQSLVYFSVSTWSPFLLHDRGPAYVALFLFILGVTGLPPTIWLATTHRPWAGSRAFYVGAGVLILMGTSGLALGLVGWAWLWAALIGLGATLVFAGGLALPAIRARSADEVAGYSGLMLTIGYLVSFVGPVTGGYLLDHTRQITSAYWPVLAASVAIVVLGVTMPREIAGKLRG